MQISYHRKAQKTLLKAPADIRRRFAAAFEAIAEDRASPNLDIGPMQGTPGFYRLRIGDYRAVYCFEADSLHIAAFGHRRNIYR